MLCAVQVIRSNYERVFNRTGFSFCKQLAYGILSGERYHNLSVWFFFPPSMSVSRCKFLCFFVQGAFITASATVSFISLDEHWYYRILDALPWFCTFMCTEEVMEWSFALIAWPSDKFSFWLPNSAAWLRSCTQICWNKWQVLLSHLLCNTCMVKIL